MSEHMNTPLTLSAEKVADLKAAFEKRFQGVQDVGRFVALPVRLAIEPTYSRRLRLLRLAPELVLGLLQSLRPDAEGRLRLAVLGDELPAGCHLEDAGWERQGGAGHFLLVLSHSSWDEVAQGVTPPDLTVTLTAAEARVVTTQPPARGPRIPEELADSLRLGVAFAQMDAPNPDETWRQLFNRAEADLCSHDACHLWFIPHSGLPDGRAEVRRLNPVDVRFDRDHQTGALRCRVADRFTAPGYFALLPTEQVESFGRLGKLQAQGPAEPMKPHEIERERSAALRACEVELTCFVSSGAEKRAREQYAAGWNQLAEFTARAFGLDREAIAAAAVADEPPAATDDSWPPPPADPAATAAPPPGGCPLGHDLKADPCADLWCSCRCAGCRAQCDAARG